MYVVDACMKMLQLRHRNLNEFIGAYVNPPAVYLCMALCAKGSVWDVINQQSILLSWDFRLSVIIDIAKVIQSSYCLLCVVAHL